MESLKRDGERVAELIKEGNLEQSILSGTSRPAALESSDAIQRE